MLSGTQRVETRSNRVIVEWGADMRTIDIGCNNVLDAGLYTFSFAETGAKVRSRFSYTYAWNGEEWSITSHHSSAMPELIPDSDLPVSILHDSN